MTVLYFASAREALDGLAEERLTIKPINGGDGPVSMEDFIVSLKVRHGDALGELLAACAFAVNEEYISGPLRSTTLAADDTVALIPPISGG